MSRERGVRERFSAKRLDTFEFTPGRRNVATHRLHSHASDSRHRTLQSHRFNTTNNAHPTSELPGGHRGYSNPLWGFGPREPRSSTLGGFGGGAVTVFLDGLSTSVTNGDVRKLCEDFGQLVDIFISRKKRKNSNCAFGFVRYEHGDGATKAIAKLDGKTFFGRKLRVTRAKYNRDGRPFPRNNHGGEKVTKTRKPILSPALRDGRNYAEVLLGRKEKGTATGFTVENGEKARNNEGELHEQVTIRTSENPVMVKRLSLAVVVDLNEPLEFNKIKSIIAENNIEAVGMSSLSRYKIAIFFEDEPMVLKAIAENSPLKKAFKDIRRWSDDEYEGERDVWIEVVGLNPKCWGQENFRAIGNIWGTTRKFVHVFNGVHCLTAAKILIRTKHLKKIEGSVTLKWESGSCDVWVKEVNYEEISEEVIVDDSDEDDTEVMADESEMRANPCASEGSREVHHNIRTCLAEKKRLVQVSEPSKNNQIVVVNEEGVCFWMQNVESIREDVGIEEEVRINAHLLAGSGESINGDDAINEEVETFVVHHNFRERDVITEDRTYGQQAIVDCVKNSEQEVVGNLNQGQEMVNDAQVQYVVSSDQSIGALALRNQTVNQVEWFDPISSVELCSSQHLVPADLGSNSHRILKRPRGRPKRLVNSLTEPLYVQSTPSCRQKEAVETWNNGKSVGVRSTKEEEVISQLRKSKRLMILEDGNSTG
ncbi:unnamed protein product [Amaranthus hypochondriacus]